MPQYRLLGKQFEHDILQSGLSSTKALIGVKKNIATLSIPLWSAGDSFFNPKNDVLKLLRRLFGEGAKQD